MKKYYSSGEFAKKAHVSLRTIRYYDSTGILHPTLVKENGARLYTDHDFAKLQQILLFKYLGFSLDEIKEMTVASADPEYLLNSLRIQKKLLQERMEEMQEMSMAIDEVANTIERNEIVEWENMLGLIHLSTMERSLRTHYLNAANISSRINLHKNYSVNSVGWFPWVFQQCDLREGQTILEIGCGNGELWIENKDNIPERIHIILTDLSEGILRDARETLGTDKRFAYQVLNCEKIPYADQSFDHVISNHVFFYCDDVAGAVRESARVLKQNGILICSTYGRNHMKEITELVQEFNENIVLSGIKLYERFGLENGTAILKTAFSDVLCRRYEDEIIID